MYIEFILQYTIMCILYIILRNYLTVNTHYQGL